MAILIDSGDDVVLRTTSVPTQQPLTVAYWFRLVSDINAVGVMHAISDSVSQYYGAFIDSSGVRPTYGSSTTQDAPVFDFTVGRWYYVAHTISSSGAHRLYIDNVLIGTPFTSSLSFSENAIFFGGDGSGNDTSARYAYAKIWEAELSQSELSLEKLFASPVRTTNLWAYYEMDAGSPYTDSSGNGRDLTSLGTPGTANSIILRDFSGSVSSGGSLIKSLNRALTAAISSSGSILKQTIRAVSGSLISAGTLNKNSWKIFIATVGSAGILNRQVNKQVAGSADSSGALSALKAFVVSLGGSLTSSSTLEKLTVKALGGSLTPGASITRQVVKEFSGTIVPAGLLQSLKTFLVTLTGSVSLQGEVTKSTFKILSGTITSAGTITKRIGKVLTGLLGALGQLLSDHSGGDVYVIDSFELIVDVYENVFSVDVLEGVFIPERLLPMYVDAYNNVLIVPGDL